MWVKSDDKHMHIKVMNYVDFQQVGHPTSVLKPTCRNNRTPWHTSIRLTYIKDHQYASVATVFPDHSKMIKLLTLFSILWVLTVTTVSCENYDYSLDIKPPESPSEPCSNYRNLTFADRNVKSNKQFYLRYGHTFPSGLGFAGHNITLDIQIFYFLFIFLLFLLQ